MLLPLLARFCFAFAICFNGLFSFSLLYQPSVTLNHLQTKLPLSLGCKIRRCQMSHSFFGPPFVQPSACIPPLGSLLNSTYLSQACSCLFLFKALTQPCIIRLAWTIRSNDITISGTYLSQEIGGGQLINGPMSLGLVFCLLYFLFPIIA